MILMQQSLNCGCDLSKEMVSHLLITLSDFFVYLSLNHPDEEVIKPWIILLSSIILLSTQSEVRGPTSAAYK